MSQPGFFEQAAFPVMAPLEAGLLPMAPLNLPGAKPPAGGTKGADTFMGIKLGKDGIPKFDKKVQQDYINNILQTYLASAQQLQAGFSTFMGGAR